MDVVDPLAAGHQQLVRQSYEGFHRDMRQGLLILSEVMQQTEHLLARTFERRF